MQIYAPTIFIIIKNSILIVVVLSYIVYLCIYKSYKLVIIYFGIIFVALLRKLLVTNFIAWQALA